MPTRAAIEEYYKIAINQDRTKEAFNPSKREVLAKEALTGSRFAKVTALNKNKELSGSCGEQDGYNFYIDAQKKKIIYAEKFWERYCE